MSSIQNNEKQLMKFAEGRKTNFGKVENKVVPLGRYARAFMEPVRTGETRAEYDKLDDQGQLRKKAENGWRFRAPVDGETRNRRSVLPATMMSFDFDYTTVELAESVLTGALLRGIPHLAHTTRRHTPEAPRIRVYLFLDVPLDAETYSAASRIICHKLIDPQMENVDPVSFRPAQMMFMPTVSKDGEYRCHIDLDGDLLDWQSYLDVFEQEVGDWRDLCNLPTVASEGELRQTKEKAEDPTQKQGPVGTFCRAYGVEDAIEKFLSNEYESVDENTGKPRYTYLGGTTRNGAEVQDDGLFLYSHHGSDPCSDMLVNAWDLVRVHKFGGMDDKINIDTPMGKRPSWKAMIEFVMKDDLYKERLVEDKYGFIGGIEEEFDAAMVDVGANIKVREGYNPGIGGTELDEIDALIGVPDKNDHVAPKYLVGEEGLPILTATSQVPPDRAAKGWLAKKCTFSPTTGKLENNLPNTRMILQNDARLYGVLQFNEFKHERVMRRDLVTRNNDLGTVYVNNKHDGDPLEDFHEDIIRDMLGGQNEKDQRGYGMGVTDRDLKSAIAIVSRQWTFHPVRHRLLSFKWDGIARLEELFIKYLGAPDDPYHRQIARLWCIAAVCRVFEPGHKFDFVPILEGLQGKGKSTFIEILALDWPGNLTANFNDSQKLMEELRNVWIAELPELGNMSRSSVEDAKAFMSSTQTTVRMAYGRNATTFKRQQVYMGSTNKSEYLADTTGNRRWWPVDCSTKEIDIHGLRRNVEKIWAEAVYLYRCMRRDQPTGTLPLYLDDPAAKREALARQESRRQQTEADHYAGMIEDYLNTPYQDRDDFGDAPWAYRHAICARELWERALGEQGRLQRGSLLEIQRAIELLGWRRETLKKTFRGYGRQKHWVRPLSEVERLEADLNKLHTEMTEQASGDDEGLI
ncbi:VapE domain-containing protein [Thioclava sp.]|uniref:VapE domain-containing protein n=1 Tax=Thioclava sp. TaxID=1933450 RepID=UPI003AA7D332